MRNTDELRYGRLMGAMFLITMYGIPMLLTAYMRNQNSGQVLLDMTKLIQ